MIKTLFEEWTKRYSNIAKLQWVYVLTIVVMTVIAGLIALLNRELSSQILFLVQLAGTVFITNLVVWALVGPIVEAKSSRSKR